MIHLRLTGLTALVTCLLLLLFFSAPRLPQSFGYGLAVGHDRQADAGTEPSPDTATKVPEEAPEVDIEAEITKGVTKALEDIERRKQKCADPYRRPGFLYLDTKGNDYNKTRWIPYSQDFLNGPDPPSVAYPRDVEKMGDIFFDKDVMPPESVLDSPYAPTQWMNKAVDEARSRKAGNPKGEEMSWVDGRVVLFVSDSIDRYMMKFMCEEFDSRAGDANARFWEPPESHKIASCVVPSLNFTVLHWHLSGMLTYCPPWWFDTQAIVAWEQRWDEVWSQTFDKLTSVGGLGPDLVLWQSTVWDRKTWLFASEAHYGKESVLATQERALMWDEIRFYAARAKKLLAFLRAHLPKNVPFMLRAMTLDQVKMGKDVQPYDLDRINRALGEMFDVEPFEWGRLLAGHAKLYKDNLHPGKGPANWLWSTMMFEYLARAVGAGTKGGARAEREPYFDSWSACHSHLM